MEPLFYSAPVCDDCWIEREGDRRRPVGDTREPIRLVTVRREVCHFCGQPTMSGIYQRARRHA